jgi:hypothetical protein
LYSRLILSSNDRIRAPLMRQRYTKRLLGSVWAIACPVKRLLG